MSAQIDTKSMSAKPPRESQVQAQHAQVQAQHAHVPQAPYQEPTSEGEFLISRKNNSTTEKMDKGIIPLSRKNS